MNQQYRKYRTTPTWKLLEIARSPDITAADLSDIVSELSERNNEPAFDALIEVGRRLEIVQQRERVLAIEQQIRDRNLIQQRDQDGYFEWPSTDAPASIHGFTGDKFFYKEGLLSYLGYRVGQQGVHQGIRQQILDCVFHNKLPNVDSREYMDCWDSPETADRLKKMAETLASLTRNAKRRRDADFSMAISDWESDLNYLYHKYFVDHFKFAWPDDLE